MLRAFYVGDNVAGDGFGFLVSSDFFKEAQTLEFHESRRCEPAQVVAHTRNSVKFTFSRYHTGREVEDLLNTVKIFSGAISIHYQTITNVRDNQGRDDLRKRDRGKVMAEMGNTDEDAAAFS